MEGRLYDFFAESVHKPSTMPELGVSVAARDPRKGMLEMDEDGDSVGRSLG